MNSKKKKTVYILIGAIVALLVTLCVLIVFLIGKQKSANVAEENENVNIQETEGENREEKPTVTPTPESTVIETPTPVVTETSTPEPTPVAKGYKIAIDPGHQGHGNSEKEPIGPGASEKKAKVSSGTTGRTSGLAEFELNLQVSLQLRDELLNRGYEVFMIRETHDVDISNSQRAKMAADEGCDILVRIHANGSENKGVAGTLTMAPSASNPFVGNMAGECQRLSQCIVDDFCAVTGSKNRGVILADNMSGINWSTIPVTIVEMGYMTNPEEDLKMASPEYQALMVQGISNGIDSYFGE